MHELKQRKFSLIVIAPISPTQLTVQWLARHKLVREEEAEAAEVLHKTPQLSVFKIGQIEFLINGQRLQVGTEEETSLPLLFDFVEGVFSVLKSSLVRAAGFNASAHYHVGSVSEWHRIGDKMAPKEPWHAFLPKEPRAGLLSITVQGARPDDFVGFRNVSIEPSKKFHPGVFINTNEHVEIPTDESEDDGVVKFLEAARHFRPTLLKTVNEIEASILE